jgi:hypothetical protein
MPPLENKADSTKASFYEELECVFLFILLGDFREHIFKPTVGNYSLHEISNGDGVRVVNFAISKNLLVKSTLFPHCDIPKFTLNHSLQNLLSSWLPSKHIKIEMYKTTILPLVLYGHDTWSFTLLEEHSLRVFENRVLRRIFGPMRE